MDDYMSWLCGLLLILLFLLLLLMILVKDYYYYYCYCIIDCIYSQLPYRYMDIFLKTGYFAMKVNLGFDYSNKYLTNFPLCTAYKYT